MEEYFKALDFSFSKKDIKNIGTTGPYGAGKSTVILSYLNTRLKKDYINVSLADFALAGKKNETDMLSKTGKRLNLQYSLLK